MKIAHIGTTTAGGAGIGMLRLHRLELANGMDSRVVCKQCDDDDHGEELYTWGLPNRRRRQLAGALRRVGIGRVPFQRYLEELNAHKRIYKEFKQYFSPASTLFRVNECPIVKEADIVHLHWTTGFLDISTFFYHLAKRTPIVWTLRDEWPLLGGFHFHELVPPNLPQDLVEIDRLQRKLKRIAFAKHGMLAFVALSKESADFARNELQNNPLFPVFRIPNPASDATVAEHRWNRENSRAHLGIPKNKKIVLFISQFLDDKRKGLEHAMRAVDTLRMEGEDIVLVAIGRLAETLPEGTIAPGFMKNPDDLVPWYHAADVFVNPSTAEGCCKTLLDAQVCGTPSVAFPHAGSKEAVGASGGIVTEEFSFDAFLSALRMALSTNWNRAEIRKAALKLFSPTKIAEEHRRLYEDLLSGHNIGSSYEN